MLFLLTLFLYGRIIRNVIDTKGDKMTQKDISKYRLVIVKLLIKSNINTTDIAKIMNISRETVYKYKRK